MNFLIVDDNPINRKLLRVTLEAEGHSVTEAADGVIALEALGQAPIDMVVSDVLMPNMDGYQLCHEIRKDLRFQRVPFVFYSSTYTSVASEDLAKEFGADRFICRPMSMNQVVQVLHEVLHEKRGRHDAEETSSHPLPAETNVVRLMQQVEQQSMNFEKVRERLLQTNHDLLKHARELENKDSEMRAVQTELEKSNAELRRNQEESQTFYHTLSHELKTPLTSAREFISIVMEGLAGALNKTQLEYLGIARESCNQLDVCINDLLDAARLETGKLSIRRERGSLDELVKRVVASLEPAAALKEIVLRYEAQPGLPEIPFDERRIAQVITNLVNNALKFTAAQQSVTVSVREDEAQCDWLRVSVRDTGCGIPATELGRIFDRLYQIKEGDATHDQGFGLGLYLCRELVELHGGRIWSESQQGKGSVFTFLLPKDPCVKPTSVLLIDDDAGVRDVLRLVLERAGFLTLTAESGKAAAEVMEKQRPDVVVLDLHMPLVDGAEVLKQLRQRRPSLPVIVYTGFPEGDVMARALESGPFTVMAKPCKPNELVATIRRVTKQEETTFWQSNNREGSEERAVSTRTEPQSLKETAIAR